MRKDGFRVHCGAPGASACPTVVTLLTGNVENLETRAALCAGRGTAFVRNPVPAPLLKKRRRAEYRLPPHSKFFANLRSIRMGIGIAVGIGVTFVFRNVYVYVNRFEVALQATEC